MNWSDAIKHDLRDAIDHVLAIKCSCDLESKCHRCKAGEILAGALGYRADVAHAIVTGETTITRLEVSRLRMEYAAALQHETAQGSVAGVPGMRPADGQPSPAYRR